MTQNEPKVLLTGGNGWLGRRVTEALLHGHRDFKIEPLRAEQVRGLVPPGEPTRPLLDLGAEVVSGDIRDPEALRSFLDDADDAVVIHLAGIIHPRRVRDFEAINVDGTAALLAASRAAGVRRLVVMSSNSPFGANRHEDETFTEDSDYNPYMGYGRSKWRMEMMLREAIEAGGKPDIVVARAPWFYGPGQPPRQTQFFSMIKEGRFPLMGAGTNRRSMGYVDSLALGILLCASKPEAAGRFYWLADERPYPMHEIIDTVRDVLRDDFGMKVKEKTISVPSVIADTARIADRALQGVGVYHQKIHVLSEMNLTIACDISRSRKELGFEPLVDLRQGMKHSISWCLENGHTI